MKKILILLTIFKATLPNACTDMCRKENNAFLRDRCYAQARSANAISANDLAYNLGQDFTDADLNYNPSSIVSSLTGSNAASSNAYNFFLDPGYNMFMGNYGMGPTNGSYIKSKNNVCSQQSQLGNRACTGSLCPNTMGSNPTINFGSNTRCDTSSVFHPLLVGWAERNVIPNPYSFQNSSNQLFQAPLSLPPNTVDSARDTYFQYLVGDPNCPAAANCSGSNGNTFTHFKGCRICDQFLNNGQSTINYKYCQFGYNWAYPLQWYGNGCTSVNLQNICVDGSNLLAYLYTWATMWLEQGAWGYLNFQNNQYAPIPATFHDLYWLWGKKGRPDEGDTLTSYSIANITDCLSIGKNNICDVQDNPTPGSYWCTAGPDNQAYSGFACIRWDKPGLLPCIPCYSNTYTNANNQLSTTSNPSGQWCFTNQDGWAIALNPVPLSPLVMATQGSTLLASWVQNVCSTTLLSPVSDSAISDCYFWDGTNEGNTSNCPYPNVQ